jgi:hypothetical protein
VVLLRSDDERVKTGMLELRFCAVGPERMLNNDMLRANIGMWNSLLEKSYNNLRANPFAGCRVCQGSLECKHSGDYSKYD